MDLFKQLTRLPGFRSVWRSLDIGSSQSRLRYGIWDRPDYAYGIYQAADQAHRLGLKKITAIEFGVAGGRGLMVIERLAARFGAELGVEIQVAGFDMGIGLPKPRDYRDLPHIWDTGFFEMDIGGLKKKLQRSTKLVLGNVDETAAAFVQSGLDAPVGFISFDLDYYSSTVEALHIFDGGPDSRLPRVYCYFDDLVWPELACHNEYTGEYLAIREFNEARAKQKICQLANLRWMRDYHDRWNDQMFIMHDFEHPLYTRNILNKAETDQLRLL